MFPGFVNLLRYGRQFHTINSNLKAKAGKAMGKVMGMQNKKKFYINRENPILPSISLFGKTPVENKITGNPRRSSVLNKLFMRNLTDLMATGEYSSQISGYGIEINQIKITPDYKILKVYWKMSSDDDLLEDILKKLAGVLRHELTQLRVMGQVPHIVFVKDKNYFKVVEIEKKLAIADFGEDHKRSDLAEHLRTETELWTVLDTEFKKNIETFDAATVEDIEGHTVSLPPMPQNVLGLNHAEILNRIKKKKQVSEGGNKKEQDNVAPTNIATANLQDFVSHKEQREAFKKFVRSRQILKSKLKKVEKNWTPDTEYLMEEAFERRNNKLEYEFSQQLEEDDYIEDFDDDCDDKKM